MKRSMPLKEEFVLKFPERKGPARPCRATGEAPGQEAEAAMGAGGRLAHGLYWGFKRNERQGKQFRTDQLESFWKA